MEDNSAKATFTADFGDRRQVDLEFPAPDHSLWVAAGPGVEIANVWMKEVSGGPDLRVRILRLGTALEIAVDRAEQTETWWPPNGAPRLLIVLDPATQTATVTASVGLREQAKAVELGATGY